MRANDVDVQLIVPGQVTPVPIASGSATPIPTTAPPAAPPHANTTLPRTGGEAALWLALALLLLTFGVLLVQLSTVRVPFRRNP